jgi:glutaredoxin
MVKIGIYFSPVCPYCPKAKELFAEVTLGFGELVEVEEINTYTEEGIERGIANQVIAVPTVIVGGRRRFVGFPFSRKELVASVEEALASSA